MPTTVIDQKLLAQHRLALIGAFSVIGLCMATWVSRTPTIRDATHSSTAEMGLIIAGMSAGSMLGIALGGVLVARYGARFVATWGLFAIGTGVAVIALGSTLGVGAVVAGGLALVGFGMGSGEIGQNVEAVHVEQRMGRTVVPGLHGSFSVGICVGALIGLVANAAEVPVALHMGIMAMLAMIVAVWVGRKLPAGTGREYTSAPGDQPAAKNASILSILREPRTMAIGLIILGMALAEGSANDWLPLIVVDGFGLTATYGALIYAFFGASMALGRFVGGRFIDRYGRGPVMAASAISAVVGIGIVSFAPNPLIGTVGVLFWGLGASLGFPVALSAAGDDPVNSARRVSIVTTAGYAAFLVGPPLLGLIGENLGLRTAILFVLAMVFVAGFFSRAVNRPAVAEADREVSL